MIQYTYVTRAEELGQIAREVAEAEYVALDFETTPLPKYRGREGAAFSPYLARPRLLSLNAGKGVYVIDLFQTGGLGPLQAVLHNPEELTGRGHPVCVLQNAKFDQTFFLHHYGVELYPVFDTLIASALLHNGRNIPHDLYALYSRELGIGPQAPDLGGSDWGGVLTPEQLDYSAEDATFLPLLRDKLKPKLAQAGLNRVAQIEFQAILPTAAVELAGFNIDLPAWDALYQTAKAKAKVLERELMQVLPLPGRQTALPGLEHFNLASPDQLLASLTKLGLREQDGSPIASTGEEVLVMHLEKFPVLEKVIAWRAEAQRVKSFGEKFLKHLNPETGRFHPSYFGLLKTGRFSCTKPALATVPRLKEYRKCFRAPEGYKRVGADYSGIEMRGAAEISGDVRLLRLFVEGKDPHRYTASVVMQKPEEEVTKAERQAAKPVNFGFIYGLGAEKFVVYAKMEYGVTLTLREAREYRARYFEEFQGITRWHQRQLSEGKRLRIARTPLGRLRWMTAEEHNEYLNCVDAETEALTTRGWVRGFDLQREDVLLTKNPFTGELEWQAMTDLRQFRNVTGRFIEFRSKSFNAVTTQDHRWLVFNKGTGQDEERTSEKLSLWGDHRIHRTGVYTGHVAAKYKDAFVALCGWFLTDGAYFPVGRRKQRQAAHLYQSQRAKPWNVAQIDSTLREGDWLMWRSNPDKRTGLVRWTLPEEVSLRLHELFPERVLTVDFLRELTAGQLHLLRATMMAGDGTRGDKDAFTAGTEAKADVFQILGVLCGVSSAKHRVDATGREANSPKVLNVVQGGVTWTVNAHRRDKVQIRQKHRRDFSGTLSVWCPIVPNTFFVARREGQVYITGNTPVQGLGADGLKAAMRCVYRRFRKFGGKAKMVHHVHDEIMVDVLDESGLPQEVAKELEVGMKEGMAVTISRVPIEVEATVGTSWADK